MPETLAWLRQRGNQAALRRLIERLTGRDQSAACISGWATGKHRPTPATEALIELVRHNPALLFCETKAMNNTEIFYEVDAAIRGTLREIGTRYADPDEATFAVCSLVPVICAVMEELASKVEPSLRNQWAQNLYRTADRMCAPTVD